MQTLLIFSGVHEVKTSGYSKAIWGPVDFKYNLFSSHCLRAKTPLFQDFPSEKMVLILPSSTKDGKSAYAT